MQGRRPACLHEVDGVVGPAALQALGGAKVLPKADLAYHVQRDTLRQVVHVKGLGPAGGQQLLDEASVDARHMVEPEPAQRQDRWGTAAWQARLGCSKPHAAQHMQATAGT